MTPHTKETITSATCLSCGLCCVSFYDQPAFCDVTAKDEQRLGKRFVRLNVIRPRQIDVLANIMDGGRALPPGAIATKWLEVKRGRAKGVSFCACTALRGDVMHKVSCSVYTRRPDVCRKAVVPGDRTCREIRKAVSNTIATASDVE